MIPARLIILLLVLGALSAACSEGHFFKNEWKNEDEIWEWEEVFSNEFEISDTLASYAIVLEIDHKRDYPFQNIYIEVETEFPGDTVVKSLIPIDMAAKSGSWYGDCRSKNCLLSVFLEEDGHFRQQGNYRLSFKQYTRRDSLRGIRSLAFKINKYENEDI